MSSEIRAGALLGVGMAVIEKGLNLLIDPGITWKDDPLFVHISGCVVNMALGKIIPIERTGSTFRERCVNAVKTGVDWSALTVILLLYMVSRLVYSIIL